MIRETISLKIYCNIYIFDASVKSDDLDGTVKSSRCKAHESLGMRRTQKYVGMTKDEAQRCRWTFYEAVNTALNQKRKLNLGP